MDVNITVTLDDIKKTVKEIRAKTDIIPEIGLILGSGLGDFADTIENSISINYEELYGFRASTVHGHGNKLIIGYIEGKKVACMKGRYHYYEGYSMFDITFPVRVLHAIGTKHLIITNASGAVNPYFKPGDFMCIEDHINNMGDSPLRGVPEEFGIRFIDMTETYSKRLKDIAFKSAQELGLTLKGGVYLANYGPAYETPAEIRLQRRVGADVIGMSTVPEVVVARQLGLEILGISCITNLAAGINPEPLSHAEVIETGKKVRVDFIRLIRKIISKL